MRKIMRAHNRIIQPSLVVTHQLQVERRTGKVRRPETDVLPLCHATNYVGFAVKVLVAIHYSVLAARNGYTRNAVV